MVFAPRDFCTVASVADTTVASVADTTVASMLKAIVIAPSL